MMKSILVVDDEAPIRRLYKEELEEEGYEVELAASGEEALEKLDNARPDLVTLDLKMPGMDGLEVLQKIRERDTKLPVIICTAYGEYRRDLTSWASDAYVVKRSNLDELKETIRRFLSKE
jgi:CheY-like chemotaxis protein